MALILHLNMTWADFGNDGHDAGAQSRNRTPALIREASQSNQVWGLIVKFLAEFSTDCKIPERSTKFPTEHRVPNRPTEFPTIVIP